MRHDILLHRFCNVFFERLGPSRLKFLPSVFFSGTGFVTKTSTCQGQEYMGLLCQKTTACFGSPLSLEYIETTARLEGLVSRGGRAKACQRSCDTAKNGLPLDSQSGGGKGFVVFDRSIATFLLSHPFGELNPSTSLEETPVTEQISVWQLHRIRENLLAF